MTDSTANPWKAVYDAILTDSLTAFEVINASLQEWLNDVVTHPIPELWRDELARFVEQAERRGLEILPESVRNIEALIESSAAGRDKFISQAAAPSNSGPAALHAVATGNTPDIGMQSAATARDGQVPADRKPQLSLKEQSQIRARQLSRALQTQLGLTDAERESAQQYYERVFVTGAAEPLPEFLREKIAEHERRIATQNAEPAMVADRSHAMSAAEIEKAQADLAASMLNAASNSYGVVSVVPERPGGSRNPLYWEHGPVDDEGDWSWILKPNLTTQEVLAAFADTQSKEAAAARTNEMLCKRVASIVVINGFIDFFKKQPKGLRERGLEWVAETLRKAGGDIERAMTVFTDTSGDERGIDSAEIRKGDQVHFLNPKDDSDGSGEEGKNVIARGQDNFAAPYAGDPGGRTTLQIQVEIQGWSEDPKPRLEEIVVNRVRRAVLPRWYIDRIDIPPKK